MNFSVFIIILLCIFSLGQVGAHCCDTCTAPNVKMYSIDKLHNKCGVSCMNPKYYDIYKIFEPGLEYAKSDTPCKDRHFSSWEKTVTHGVWPIQATLDMYNPDAGYEYDTRCCVACPAGKSKYSSVDTANNQCGESCIKDSEFWLYNVLLKNLTKATNDTPCADLKYGKYVETETQGVYSVTVEVDLYKPIEMPQRFLKN